MVLPACKIMVCWQVAQEEGFPHQSTKIATQEVNEIKASYQNSVAYMHTRTHTYIYIYIRAHTQICTDCGHYRPCQPQP